MGGFGKGYIEFREGGGVGVGGGERGMGSVSMLSNGFWEKEGQKHEKTATVCDSCHERVFDCANSAHPFPSMCGSHVRRHV